LWKRKILFAVFLAQKTDGPRKRKRVLIMSALPSKIHTISAKNNIQNSFF